MSSSKDRAASSRESSNDSGRLSNEAADVSRRNFMGAALGAAAGAGAVAMMPASAQTPPPTGVPGSQRPTPSPASAPPAGSGLEYGTRPGGPRLFRVECDIADVEVEGKIPAELEGAFYRTGPDAQYPLAPGNIPFD